MRRIKLFSDNEGGMILRDLICKDCGYTIHTAETPTHAVCPNCGGRRMDIKIFNPNHDEELERRSLFQKDIYTKRDPFEDKLKVYSGSTMDEGLFEKTFSGKTEQLLEKGFAEKVGNSYEISKDAYEMQRLFSKLTISITKTLELDPDMVESSCDDKENIIEHLKHCGSMPGKSIILMKKAHGIPLESDRVFSDCCSDCEEWIEDSSIIPDLEYEYNNQSFSLGQFLKILKNRYPDAPENIIDILVDKGVVLIDGNQVTIHKK